MIDEIARIWNFEKSRQLSARAHHVIPGGAHTYSKGDDQFPENAPRFIERGEGGRCWDVDGNEYVDWAMGLRAVVLGHAYPRVIDAVSRELHRGSSFARPSPIETELAERLTELIPSAQMVKLAKNGSDVTSAAVRLARAYTGRDLIARCRESAFHAFYDWFIGSTVVSGGVPQGVRDLTVQFPFNDAAALEALFEAHPGRIAGVIMEPCYTDPPRDGYLAQVRELTRRHGAVLIFDEVISGFRWHLRGAQAYFGVTPDLSCFGKALGNGFSVSALVGRRDIMELGGIHHRGPKVFLLSATHGGETHAIAAALATIAEMQERDVIAHIWRVGQLLIEAFNRAAREHAVDQYLFMTGYPCNPQVVCRDHEGQLSADYRTLFLQEMIAHGVLMPHVSIAFAHGERELELTISAASATMSVYRNALEARNPRTWMIGPAVRPVFRATN